jgi:hypothetical protein
LCDDIPEHGIRSETEFVQEPGTVRARHRVLITIWQSIPVLFAKAFQTRAELSLCWSRYMRMDSACVINSTRFANGRIHAFDMITAAIVLMLGLAGQVASFIQDAILLDSQKADLRHKFETWWKVVAQYDQVKLALALAEKSSQLLDFLFGPCHFSKKLFKKCTLFSTSLLVATFAILSFFSHGCLGFAPWKAYTESIDSVVKITDGFLQPVNYTPIHTHPTALSKKMLEQFV